MHKHDHDNAKYNNDENNESAIYNSPVYAPMGQPGGPRMQALSLESAQRNITYIIGHGGAVQNHRTAT